MNRTLAQKEAAEQVLRGRAELPADAAAWGRTWKLTPAEATTLIARERRRREQTG